jgi:hypothetical protein
MSGTRTVLRIDGGEPIELINAPEEIVDEVETALRDGAVLRLRTIEGTFFLNGKTASTVVVAIEQPTGAEAIH